jgi:hypothetical protein
MLDYRRCHRTVERLRRPPAQAIFLDDFFWEWLFGNNAPERPEKADVYGIGAIAANQIERQALLKKELAYLILAMI